MNQESEETKNKEIKNEDLLFMGCMFPILLFLLILVAMVLSNPSPPKNDPVRDYWQSDPNMRRQEQYYEQRDYLRERK